MVDMILEILFEGIMEIIVHALSSAACSIWQGIREIFG